MSCFYPYTECPGTFLLIWHSFFDSNNVVKSVLKLDFLKETKGHRIFSLFFCRKINKNWPMSSQVILSPISNWPSFWHLTLTSSLGDIKLFLLISVKVSIMISAPVSVSSSSSVSVSVLCRYRNRNWNRYWYRYRYQCRTRCRRRRRRRRRRRYRYQYQYRLNQINSTKKFYNFCFFLNSWWQVWMIVLSVDGEYN